jgi:hypothetical protein
MVLLRHIQLREIQRLGNSVKREEGMGVEMLLNSRKGEGKQKRLQHLPQVLTWKLALLALLVTVLLAWAQQRCSEGKERQL